MGESLRKRETPAETKTNTDKEVEDITLPTMTDHVQGIPVKADLPAPIPFHKGLLDNVSDGNEHALKSFLERPVIIRSGSISTTATANTEIDSVALPEDLLTNQPVFTSKINGFLGFRATFVIRLQINANRMQQGRLMMTFFPADNVAVSKHQSMQNSLMMRTQLPRVDFDLATDSEVIMEIPFISPYLAYDTTAGTGHVGHVGLVIYSPLVVSTAETSVYYNIWGSFKDVELMFPTISNSTYVPQAGGKKKRLFGSSDPSVIEEEYSGFLSKPLQKISKATGILSEIPLLSSVAGPVSWFTGVSAGVASAFGFSNPLRGVQPDLVAQRVFNKGNNCSGHDLSHNLGLFEDQQIEHLPGFAGQDVDEMTIAYPLSIPTFYTRTTWSATTPEMFALFNIPLRPNSLTGTAAVGYSTTPVSYFANFFRYYRGSLKFKFKIVKTEFHSGRLAFVYLPGSNGSTTVANNNMAYLHRDIVDIRDSNEVEFTCPWASTLPFLECNLAYGNLQVLVINQLRNPDTVASSVDIICEVSAEPDFRFAQPRTDIDIPYLNINALAPQSGDDFLPQGGSVDVGQDHRKLVEGSVAGGLGSAKELIEEAELSSRVCIGEVILSLRQLLKRSVPFAKVVVTPANGAWFLKLNPWAVTIPVYNTVASTWLLPSNLSSAGFQPDYYSSFAVCYAFSRGSVRIRNYAENINNCGADYRVSLWSPATEMTTLYSSTSNATNTPVVSFLPAIGSVYPAPEVQVPYYNKAHMSYVALDGGNSSSPANIAQGTLRPKTYVSYSNAASGGQYIYHVHRQTGEDQSFGLWTGSPYLIPQASLPPGLGAFD